MQIHEIFRKRTNEGVLKGVPVAKQPSAPGFTLGQRAGQIGKAVAHNLAGQILQKAGLLSHGGETGDTAGFGSARGAAGQANEVLVKHQAKQLMDLWNKSLEKLSSDGVLTAADNESMRRGLWRDVHNNIMRGQLGNNYQNLPGQVWPTPAVQKEANQIVSALGQALKTISSKMSKTTLQDWEALTRSAYQAMSLAQFENARTREQPLTKEEEARRQVEIDKLKAEILAKEQQLAQINQEIKSGTYKPNIKAIAQQVAKEIAADRTKLANIMLNRNPNDTTPAVAEPTATSATAEPAPGPGAFGAMANQLQRPATAAPSFGKGTPMPTTPYQVPGAKTSATPVNPAATAPAPSFGKGTPMPTTPYQVPGAKTSARPVPPTATTPAGPKVVSGGPTPAERARLAQRIAQASGTKA